MKNESTAYWEKWQQLIEAAANFQELVPGSVLIGGSAAAVHLQHRYSFDADHVLMSLQEKYEEILDFLEGRDDWETARLHPPKLILGNFQGIETGIRQLRRTRPLEIEVIERGGKALIIPTLPEMLRTKAWMIVSRNATRDFIDVAALAKHIGIAGAAEILKDLDAYYVDIIRGDQASPVVQLLRQLAEPAPYDLDAVNTSQYKGIRSPFDSWNAIQEICEALSVAVAELLV